MNNNNNIIRFIAYMYVDKGEAVVDSVAEAFDGN